MEMLVMSWKQITISSGKKHKNKSFIKSNTYTL